MIGCNVFTMLMDWMNDAIRVNKIETELLNMVDTLLWLTVLLCSHHRLYYGENNIFAKALWVCSTSSAMCEVDYWRVLGFFDWQKRARRRVQLDFTTLYHFMFNEVWKHSAQKTCNVYLVSHSFTSLDDVLFDTRAVDSQVKIVSAHKANKEGHSTDTVADSMSQIIFALWFRWREETQLDAVKTLFSFIFEERKKEAHNNCILIADR